MADIQLSPKAQKLLKHFQDKQLRQRDFEYPATQEAVFGNPEDCEAAQAELAKAGILELSRSRPTRGRAWSARR